MISIKYKELSMSFINSVNFQLRRWRRLNISLLPQKEISTAESPRFKTKYISQLKELFK